MASEIFSSDLGRGGGAAGSLRRVIKNCRDGSRECGGVSGRVERTGAALDHGLPQSPYIRGNDRRSARHRLQHREPEAFFAARLDAYVGAPVIVGKFKSGINGFATDKEVGHARARRSLAQTPGGP